MASPQPVLKNFEDFASVHGTLLAASGLPPALYRQLFEKLSLETFDGGSFFSIEPCEGGRLRCLVLTAEFMAKESCVFLIDHAWTFRLLDALKQLREVPGLAERMASLMCVDSDGSLESVESEKNRSELDVMEILGREIEKGRERGSDAVWLELEELCINDEMLCSMNLCDRFSNLVALNLWGNELRDPEILLQEVGRCKNLKALWLNDNPVLNERTPLGDRILALIPGLEIYNSLFTCNFGEWALAYCGGIYSSDCPDDSPSRGGSSPLGAITSLDLSDRCIKRLSYKREIISDSVMPSLSHLNLRGNPLNEDSENDMIKCLQGLSNLKLLEVDIPGPLGSSAMKIIEALPGLSSLNGVDTRDILENRKHVVDSGLQPRFPEWKASDTLAERVIAAMWPYLMTYRLADMEKIDDTPVWYVMDELGSALRHSDSANFRVAPFLYMPNGNIASSMSFSILWPTQNVVQGEECTRDFLFGIGEEKQRSARLTAWFHTPEDYFIQEFLKYQEKLLSRKLPSPREASTMTTSALLADGRPLRVYTDIPQVEDYLRRPEFVLSTSPKDADIIWTSRQVDEEMKKALGLGEHHYFNQFPFEACLVMKHHLAETIQKALGFPAWLQRTYNLETQLTELIGDYCHRKRENLDNLWILKPWNMARTIDTTVTSDLSAIIRLMETGPKICQKYIEQPALFRGRKFDLRYIVLVRSMNPLEIFLLNVFWVRLANNPYTLNKNSLFEYETHFTVMNYIGRLHHMNAADFSREFEKEHQIRWLDIHERIRKMIRSTFESASAMHPGMQSSSSRVIYGIDVMVDANFNPKLLEVTYCPDCHRACQHDSEAVVGSHSVLIGHDFFNVVFGCLFLGEVAHVSPL
ncbi:tubulin-tyrosine ligase isoform X2 [Wolffia australiana]